MPDIIRVKTGETFQIPLQGQAGTGFRWEVKLSDAASQHVTLVTTDRDAVSTIPGGPIVQQFQLRALAPGTVTLTFRHRRSWEASDSGAVHTVEVHIDPA